MKKVLSLSILIASALLASQASAHGRAEHPKHSLVGTERCVPVTDSQIESLFDRWNSSLATGDPVAVVKNYAKDSVLLATVSNVPRDTPEEKVDYFTAFLKKTPQGEINFRHIYKDCNTAIDAGTYTFTLGDGSKVPARYTFTYKYFGKKLGWLITTHHSSMMPEKADAPAVH